MNRAMDLLVKTLTLTLTSADVSSISLTHKDSGLMMSEDVKGDHDGGGSAGGGSGAGSSSGSGIGGVGSTMMQHVSPVAVHAIEPLLLMRLALIEGVNNTGGGKGMEKEAEKGGQKGEEQKHVDGGDKETQRVQQTCASKGTPPLTSGTFNTHPCPLNTPLPSQHTLSTQPLNSPSQPTLSTGLLALAHALSRITPATNYLPALMSFANRWDNIDTMGQPSSSSLSSSLSQLYSYVLIAQARALQEGNEGGDEEKAVGGGAVRGAEGGGAGGKAEGEEKATGAMKKRYQAANHLAIHITKGIINHLFTVHDHYNTVGRSSIFAGGPWDSFYAREVCPIRVNCSYDGMLWVVATILQLLLTARPSLSATHTHDSAILSDHTCASLSVNGLFNHVTTTDLIVHLFRSHRQVDRFALPPSCLPTNPLFFSYPLTSPLTHHLTHFVRHPLTSTTHSLTHPLSPRDPH